MDIMKYLIMINKKSPNFIYELGDFLCKKGIIFLFLAFYSVNSKFRFTKSSKFRFEYFSVLFCGGLLCSSK